MEPHSAAPLNSSHYDFIINPQKPKRHGLLGRVGGDSFVLKIALIVGGAIVLMIALALLVNLFVGGKTSLDTIVGLTQSEQEINRLGAQSRNATSQDIKDAATNTQLSVKSHQQKWLAFLKQYRRDVGSDQLNLRKDTSTDTKLKAAQQTSTFDTTYAGVMRSLLQSYGASIKSAYQGTANQQERAILSTQYDDVQLLLKQWP